MSRIRHRSDENVSKIMKRGNQKHVVTNKRVKLSNHKIGQNSNNKMSAASAKLLNMITKLKISALHGIVDKANKSNVMEKMGKH